MSERFHAVVASSASGCCRAGKPGFGLEFSKFEVTPALAPGQFALIEAWTLPAASFESQGPLAVLVLARRLPENFARPRDMGRSGAPCPVQAAMGGLPARTTWLFRVVRRGWNELYERAICGDLDAVTEIPAVGHARFVTIVTGSTGRHGQRPSAPVWPAPVGELGGRISAGIAR